jgi:hypothetical protein
MRKNQQRNSKAQVGRKAKIHSKFLSGDTKPQLKTTVFLINPNPLINKWKLFLTAML